MRVEPRRKEELNMRRLDGEILPPLPHIEDVRARSTSYSHSASSWNKRTDGYGDGCGRCC
jgi:hypothetical protein